MAEKTGLKKKLNFLTLFQNSSDSSNSDSSDLSNSEEEPPVKRVCSNARQISDLNSYEEIDVSAFFEKTEDIEVKAEDKEDKDIQSDIVTSSAIDEALAYRGRLNWPYKDDSQCLEDLQNGKSWIRVAIEKENGKRMEKAITKKEPFKNVEKIPVPSWLDLDEAEGLIISQSNLDKNAIEKEDNRDYMTMLKEIDMKKDVSLMFMAEMREAEMYRKDQKLLEDKRAKLKERARNISIRERNITAKVVNTTNIYRF